MAKRYTVAGVIDKYFNDRCKYYNPGDLIAADHYIAQEYCGKKVVLSIGCNEGEIKFGVYSDAEKLEKAIKFIIYGGF